MKLKWWNGGSWWFVVGGEPRTIMDQPENETVKEFGFWFMPYVGEATFSSCTTTLRSWCMCRERDGLASRREARPLTLNLVAMEKEEEEA